MHPILRKLSQALRDPDHILVVLARVLWVASANNPTNNTVRPEIFRQVLQWTRRNFGSDSFLAHWRLGALRTCWQTRTAQLILLLGCG
jgi:hypothetical protein